MTNLRCFTNFFISYLVFFYFEFFLNSNFGCAVKKKGTTTTTSTTWAVGGKNRSRQNDSGKSPSPLTALCLCCVSGIAETSRAQKHTHTHLQTIQTQSISSADRWAPELAGITTRNSLEWYTRWACLSLCV